MLAVATSRRYRHLVNGELDHVWYASCCVILGVFAGHVWVRWGVRLWTRRQSWLLVCSGIIENFVFCRRATSAPEVLLLVSPFWLEDHICTKSKMLPQSI